MRSTLSLAVPEMKAPVPDRADERVRRAGLRHSDRLRRASRQRTLTPPEDPTRAARRGVQPFAPPRNPKRAIRLRAPINRGPFRLEARPSTRSRFE
jgi:hypothetical protein